MENRKKLPEFPLSGWLSDHMTHKMVFVIVLVALAGWFILCGLFLSYLEDYVDTTYDSGILRADDAAQQAGAFYIGCGGDAAAMNSYLERENLYCTVRDAGGRLLYERMDMGPDMELTASGWTEMELSQGETVKIQVWERAMERNEINQTLRSNAFLAISVLDACIFLVVAVAMYLLVVGPIIRLRQTMRRYYEKGERPARTQRRDEVGKLQNAFADLVEAVECKEQAERRLIASISHDIKTPLTSVMGYSERLQSPELSPEKREKYQELVYEKALRIKAVVDEFDEYLDAGLKDNAPMVLTTAGELCKKLQREYADELADAGAVFTVRCGCSEAQLVCSWEHMRRLFGNLISNSFQHGGAEKLTLELTCEREGVQVIFRFRDNGRGVPCEELQRIFEPLYTSDQGRKVSGLGLSICKSIVRAHGGSISAENDPRGGLCIRIALPEVHI